MLLHLKLIKIRLILQKSANPFQMLKVGGKVQAEGMEGRPKVWTVEGLEVESEGLGEALWCSDPTFLYNTAQTLIIRMIFDFSF